MQQQERDLIAGLFGRLQQFENQPRDSEAERLIADYVSRQPAAVYLLTQTAIVQEEALKQAKARIAELENNASETSFLGSAPKIGRVAAGTSSRNCGSSECPSIQLSRVCASHAVAPAALHGASTGTWPAIWSSWLTTRRRSGRISGSNGAVPVRPASL